jgi:glycosyltransferase involved in cell wall biosynthesis
MKRILHIPNYYPPHTGGIEDVCHTIVKWLATLPDVRQQVFCFSDKAPTAIDHIDGVRVVRVGSVAKIASQAIAPRYLDRLHREMRRFRPGFVHFHAPNPLAAACLLPVLPRGVKLIVHWHSDIVDQKRLYQLIRPLEAALLRRADTVVATSPLYIDGSKSLGRFREKCTVIPNVVDTAKLTPHQSLLDQIRWRYGDKPLLLFVGRHVPYKGLEHMLGAVPRVKHDCCVVVGGTGPLSERLHSNHASERVHFTGRIPDEELAAWYTAADLFLFPSITRNEAFGMALAEAMWCGTPAVTFTIEGSGVNWVNLNGVTGIEVDNGNEEQLAAAIDHLLEHDEMRREYGRNAHRRVAENMTLETIAPALEELYA